MMPTGVSVSESSANTSQAARFITAAYIPGEFVHNALTSILDKLDVGVAIVSSNAEVLFSNRECQRIFAACDGISICNSAKVQLKKRAANAHFHSSIKALSGSHTVASGSSSGNYCIDRPSGKTPYVLEVCPLVTNMKGAGLRGATLFIRDMEHRPTFKPEGLRRMFELTKAELQVAELILEGNSNQEIAKKRNVSLETVRSQAKNILHKAGCQTRNDLLRLAAAVNLPIK